MISASFKEKKMHINNFHALPGVYAFGFLFMLPQLFVNYKVCLLSVLHAS